MSNSQRFSAQWFADKTQNWSEGPRLDFKQQVYKLTNDTLKFEYIKDIIAFANVARRTGQPCWILFGVDDKQRLQQLYDVADQYPGRKPPPGWFDRDVSIHAKQTDGVEKVLRETLEGWIQPSIPEINLQYGIVGEAFVSYLEIEPVLTLAPFALRRPSAKFGIGTVFIRKNSSTVAVAPSEVHHLLSASESEYLRGVHWTRAIAGILAEGGEFERAATLSPPFESRVLAAERPALDAVLASLDNLDRVVMVSGHAGQGKTVLLLRTAYALARRHSDLVTRRTYFGQGDDLEPAEDQTVVDITSELESVPAEPIPIFMTLRTAFESRDQLEHRLLTCARQLFGKRDITALVRLFRIPGSRWILLLDGLDEVRNKESFAPQLRAWIEELPSNVQVVITSRPRIAPPITGVVIPLAHLTPDEALYILKGKLLGATAEIDEDLIANVETWLRQNPDLFSLISRHRALDGLVSYLSGNSVSAFVSQIDMDVVRIASAPAPSVRHDDQVMGEVPIITMEMHDSEFAEAIKGVEQKPPTDDPWIPPSLGIALQTIVEHMRTEELKREAEWGQDVQQRIDLAEYCLEHVAWRIDWATNYFDPIECERKGWLDRTSLALNEDIGFVERQRARRYAFICSLLRQFLAARFAYDESNEEGVRRRFLEHHSDRLAAHGVLRLLNELRQVHGREALSIQ